MAFTAANADQGRTSGVMHLAQATTQPDTAGGTAAAQPRNVQETQPAHSAPVPTGQPGMQQDAVGQTAPGTAGGTAAATTPGVGATADPAAPRDATPGAMPGDPAAPAKPRARPARQVKG
jgi:hypothetical protein